MIDVGGIICDDEIEPRQHALKVRNGEANRIAVLGGGMAKSTVPRRIWRALRTEAVEALPQRAELMLRTSSGRIS